MKTYTLNARGVNSSLVPFYTGRGDADFYSKYFRNQVGGSVTLPVFRGRRLMKGSGIGSVLGGLFKSIAPALKRGAKVLGKQALRGATDFAGDILRGENAGVAAKKRLRERGKGLLDDVKVTLAEGPPGKRPAKRKRPTGNKHPRKKRKTIQLYDIRRGRRASTSNGN